MDGRPTLWNGDLLGCTDGYSVVVLRVLGDIHGTSAMPPFATFPRTSCWTLRMGLTTREMPFVSKGASMLNRDMIGRILSKESTMRMWGCSLLYSASSSSHSVTHHCLSVSSSYTLGNAAKFNRSLTAVLTSK